MQWNPSTPANLSIGPSQITQRELGVYMKRTAGSMKATERARKVMPLGRAVELPGIRPASDRGAQGPGRVDGRRRRQSLRRLRPGLRRPVLRPLQPGRAPGDRAPTRRRHLVRHAVRVERRRRRDARGALQPADVAVHQQRHRGDDGRHPRRAWLHRSRQDRQGRGRLPRSSRRGDDLDEATDQRGRPGRRTARHPGNRGHHARRARRHQGHSRTTDPICSRRRWPVATWLASSSSR